MKLREKVIAFRQQEGLTQKDLSAVMGLSISSIKRMEKGDAIAESLALLALAWIERNGWDKVKSELEHLKGMTGKQLKLKRIELDLDQRQLANYLGVSHAAISRWEKGKVDISHMGLIRLALDELEYQLNEEKAATAQGLAITETVAA